MAFKMKGFSPFKTDDKAKKVNILKEKWNDLEDQASTLYNNALMDNPNDSTLIAKHKLLKKKADEAYDAWQAAENKKQMARQVFVFEKKKRTKRKGVHAKSKTSTNKGSNNYVKIYNQQGR